MKIIQFTAENVKKLKVVDITPSDGLNQITGKNESGKTSVLDSIWWALGGTKDIQDTPIRTGADSGRVRLDLGDLIVERRFLSSGSTTLDVRNAVGSAPGTPDKKLPKWGSPQEILDSLIGRLSFDPLSFANKKSREQYEELKAIAEVSIDIDALEAQNAEDFKRRTDVNREAKAKHAQAEGIVIPADLPESPIDETAILNQMQQAAAHNADIETRKAKRESAARTIAEKKALADRLRAQAEAHRKHAASEVARLERELEAYKQSSSAQAALIDAESEAEVNRAAELQRQLDAAPALPAPIDVADLRASIDAARATNAGIQKRQQRDKILKEATALDAESAQLTQAMADRDKAKADAIAAAKMPIPGLSLAAGRVLLNGLPFDQASGAQRLKTSVAIAMAGNPKLRVIRIKDGSLLDEDGIAMIADMARERDYQVWLERVDSSGKIGIVLEDGEVVSGGVA